MVDLSGNTISLTWGSKRTTIPVENIRSVNFFDGTYGRSMSVLRMDITGQNGLTLSMLFERHRNDREKYAAEHLAFVDCIVSVIEKIAEKNPDLKIGSGAPKLLKWVSLISGILLLLVILILQTVSWANGDDKTLPLEYFLYAVFGVMPVIMYGWPTSSRSSGSSEVWLEVWRAQRESEARMLSSCSEETSDITAA